MQLMIPQGNRYYFIDLAKSRCRKEFQTGTWLRIVLHEKDISGLFD
jgi:hypothetical protein